MNVLEAITQAVKQTGEYSLVGTQASGGDIVPDYTVDNGILYYLNKALRQLSQEMRVDSQKKVAYFHLREGSSRVICPNLILIDSLSLKNVDGEYAVVTVANSGEVVTDAELSDEENASLELKVSLEPYEYSEVFLEEVTLKYVNGTQNINYGIRYAGEKFYIWGGTTNISTGYAVFEFSEAFADRVSLLSGIVDHDPAANQAARGDAGVLTLDDDTEMTVVVDTLTDTRFRIYDTDEVTLYTSSVLAGDILEMRLVGNTLYVLFEDTVNNIDVYRVIDDGTAVQLNSQITLADMLMFDASDKYVAVYVNDGATHSINVYISDALLSETIELDGIFAFGSPLYGMRLHGEDLWVWDSQTLMLMNLEGEIMFSQKIAHIADIAFNGDFMYILTRTSDSANNTVAQKARYVNAINTRSLLFNFTSDADYVVKIRGRFAPKDVVSLYETNYWLNRCPQLVIDLTSHFINFPRLSAASNALLWGELQNVKNNLVFDDVEQEIAISGSQIRG